LSGGAAFGRFHFGVLKALYENDLMPRTIAGSSVGSLIAAAFASHKYSDLWKCFNKDYNMMTGEFFKWKFNNLWEAIGMLKRGEPIFETEVLKNGAYRFTKDLTFLEIYE
jgi:NTE family protein